MRLRAALAGFLMVAVAGCASRGVAPVIDRLPSGSPVAKPAAKPAPQAVTPATAARQVDGAADTYTVKRGDTLYSIALDHGQDYREMAQWNNLDNPNLIRENQVLRVRPPENSVQVRPLAGAGSVESRPAGSTSAALAKPAAAGGVLTEPQGRKLPYSEENLALLQRDPKPAAAPTVAAAPPKPALELKPAGELKPAAPPKPAAEQTAKPEADDDAPDWGWPTAGRTSAGFSESTNKGIDIAGKQGQPVVASATGTVSYIGTGIPSYGRLIVLKHGKEYLSVYAHNESVLVKEGQRVVKGQKIAEMGNTGTDQVKLHFEIRRLGKPVDPVKFLPGR